MGAYSQKQKPLQVDGRPILVYCAKICISLFDHVIHISRPYVHRSGNTEAVRIHIIQYILLVVALSALIQ